MAQNVLKIKKSDLVWDSQRIQKAEEKRKNQYIKSYTEATKTPEIINTSESGSLPDVGGIEEFKPKTSTETAYAAAVDNDFKVPYSTGSNTPYWDEEALRGLRISNMAKNDELYSGPVVTAVKNTADKVYNKIVNPVANKVYDAYEYLDDYAFNENDFEYMRDMAVKQSGGNVWSEDALRLNRIVNERNELLDQMTDAQRYIYNSLPENEKKDYLDSIHNELNQKLGAKTAEYVLGEGKDTAVPAAYAFAAGISNFTSGLKGAGNLLRGAEGEIVTRGPMEYAYSEIAPNLSGGGKVLSDLAYTTGNMVPSMALGALSGGLGTAAMGISSAGNSYDTAISEGYSPEQAAAYGIVSGVKEAALQKTLGGLPGVSNAQSALSKALGKYGKKAAEVVIKNPALRDSLLNIAGKALSEGSEEYVQELLDAPLRNLFLGENNEIKLFTPEAAYSAALGALSGGAFALPGAVGTYRDVKAFESDKANFSKRVQEMMINGMDPDRLIKIGETPNILKKYGANPQDIIISQDTIRKIVYPEGYMGGKHNLGFYFLNQLITLQNLDCFYSTSL